MTHENYIMISSKYPRVTVYRLLQLLDGLGVIRITTAYGSSAPDFFRGYMGDDFEPQELNKANCLLIKYVIP